MRRGHRGIGQRAADEIRDRYALRQSDLLLLADDAETQRLFRAHAAGTAEETATARRAAEAYLQRAWQLVAYFSETPLGGSIWKVELGGGVVSDES